MHSNLFALISAVACGVPAFLFTLAGAGVTLFGFLADQRQLKLDTNLERGSLIRFGITGLAAGLLLVAFAVGLWMLLSPK